MITQNLHSFFREKTKDKRRKTSLKRLVFPFVFILLPFTLKAQDSIVPQSNVSEKTNLDFQEHFFKALTEKAIKNYQNAINSLDECNQLIPNNKAVLFELSKNYLALKKYPEAIEYGNEALVKDSENIWILEHLVKVNRKSYNFKKAIELQEKIAIKHPKKKQQLVFLHLQNSDRESAKKVLNELAEAKMLNHRLRRLQKSLNASNSSAKTTKKNTKTVIVASNLKEVFEKNKSYKSLQNLLTDLDTKNSPDLLKYSEKGMSLFPAQPFVYLMNGKALNKQKKHKKAVESLQNGIDFVIDNPKMENSFFTELVNAYNGLGDTKNAKKYKKKLK